MSNEQQKTWRYPLSAVRMDQSGPPTNCGSRTGGGNPVASELVGWDGNAEGGLRPFPGFHAMTLNGTPLRVKAWDGVSAMEEGGFVQPGDFFPVAVRDGASGYEHGVIYRSCRIASTGQPSGRPNLIYQPLNSSFSSVRLNTGTHLTNHGNVDNTKFKQNWPQMDVAVRGRLIYIFIEGQSPILHIPSTNTTELTPGPGDQPRLYAADEASGVALLALNVASPNLARISIAALTPGEISHPTQTGIQIRGFSSGNYAFAYQLYDERSGRRSGISEVQPLQPRSFDPTTGDIDIAGAASPTAGPFLALEINYLPADWTHVYVYRSVRTEDAGGVFSAGYLFQETFQRLADITNAAWTTVPFGYSKAVWYYVLEDKQLVVQDRYVDYFYFDAEMPKAGTGIIHEDVCYTSLITNTTAQWQGNPNKYAGEIRWSSPTEASPELFSPLARYTPSSPSDSVIRFLPVGGNLVGFSRNKQYVVRRESDFVKVMDQHEGYGLISARAAESVGSYAYFANSQGVFTVDGNGNIDDINAVNYVIREKWAGKHENVTMGLDPTHNVLFIHNPSAGARGETVCLWLRTGRATTLSDTKCFTNVAKGFSRGYDGEGSTDPLLSRAIWVDYLGFMFVSDYARERKATAMYSRVFTGNTRRTFRPILGDGYGTFTRVGSGQTGYVPGTGPGQQSYILSYSGATLTAGAASMLIGSYLYASGSSTLEPGQSWLIVDWNGTNVTVQGINPGATPFTAHISPPYCRWRGHQLTMVDEDGVNYRDTDFFTIRSASTLAASFADVTSPALVAGLGRFNALLYRSNGSAPIVSALPVDTNGTTTTSISNYEGIHNAAFTPTGSIQDARLSIQGSSMFPGLETWVSDVDFLLLEVIVSGKMLPTTRNRRATT